MGFATVCPKLIVIFLGTLFFLGVSFTFIALSKLQIDEFDAGKEEPEGYSDFSPCDKVSNSYFGFYEMKDDMRDLYSIIEDICIACFSLTIGIWVVWCIVAIKCAYVPKTSFILYFLMLFGVYLAFATACLAIIFSKMNDVCKNWCSGTSSDVCWNVNNLSCDGTCLDDLYSTSFLISLAVIAVCLLLYILSMSTQWCLDRFKSCVEYDEDEEYHYRR
jgi:hypothetical protein